MRTQSYLSIGDQVKPGTGRRNRGAGWIIGIMAIALLSGSSAFGQFIVQPMRVELGVNPGRRIVTKLAVENLSDVNTEVVDLRLVDMSQDPNGIWQPIEPDAEVVEGANGGRWVMVGDADNHFQIDISGLRSCQDWLRLRTDTVSLGPLERKEIDLQVTVPGGTRGYYCAALLAQTRLRPTEGEMAASVVLQFIIPVIIEVQGRTMRYEIDLTNVHLEFRPQEDVTPAATVVSMAIANSGGTYNRLVGIARIWGQTGGHWRKIMDAEFNERGIIPGVKLNLKESIDRPLPAGTYKVQGVLYVDGRRSKTMERVIEYSGDKRLANLTSNDHVGVQAALDLDPRELTIETFPGATRGQTLKVINASEEAVEVDVEVAVPDEMRYAVVTDGQGRTLRGEQMSCVEWLDIRPRQFTLRGHTSRNLRVTARMPDSEDIFPNYYATVRLRARYPDGQTAGSTPGRVYVENRKLNSQPRIIGTVLTMAESAPERYFVTAHYSNSGNAHVLPRVRAVLTMISTGALAKQIDLSGEAYERSSGNMLPCETRKFSGVMDIRNVPTGRYRLTSIFDYGIGLSEQIQKIIEIKEVNDQKVVDFLDVEDYGTTVINL